MPLIQWTSDLSVNVSKFDTQHKRLIDLINELHDAMKVGKGNQILHKILEDMMQYTKTHFADEEALMKQYNYPGYTIQKIQHDKFVQELQDLQRKLLSNTTTLTMEVMNFLKQWLTNHIQKTDKAYAPFFESKNVR
ncbi:MAG: bacteriohemerythrin [Bacteroidetes bacterium]|nr:bacteriohemerythrin [Bacteroidota bacterium]